MEDIKRCMIAAKVASGLYNIATIAKQHGVKVGYVLRCQRDAQQFALQEASAIRATYPALLAIWGDIKRIADGESSK